MSCFVSCLVVAVATTGADNKSKSDFGYVAVKSIITPAERKDVPDIWALDFEHRSPRYIQVDVPGEGRKILWYMTYKITNPNPEAKLFIPRFTLVTDNNKVYEDVIMPRAEELISHREDPVRRVTQPYLNSVTIAKEAIPGTPADAKRIERYGVAIWKDVDMATKGFVIYVSGLSNGYVRVNNEETKKSELKIKTLKIQFSKPGDVFYPTEREIRLTGEPIWTYR